MVDSGHSFKQGEPTASLVFQGALMMDYLGLVDLSEGLGQDVLAAVVLAYTHGSAPTSASRSKYWMLTTTSPCRCG